MRGLIFLILLALPALAGSGAGTLLHPLEGTEDRWRAAALASADPVVHDPAEWPALSAATIGAFGAIEDPRSGSHDSDEGSTVAERPSGIAAAVLRANRPSGSAGFVSRLNHPPYLPTAPPSAG
jgi:hypothetical protein